MSPSYVEVHAVVVGYYPETKRLGELLVGLLGEVAVTHVIDNTPQFDTRVEELLADLDLTATRLVRLGENLGIAKALNIGIDNAIAAGATHVLLSDQDSLPEAGMVEALISTERELAEEGIRVGAVAPIFTDTNAGITFPFQVDVQGKFFYGHARPDEASPVVEALTLITSGVLIPVRAIESVGTMCESLFIDMVDFEWCHRARAKGWRLFGTGRARMHHSFGTGEWLRVWFFGWRREPAYSPLRMYYRFRNFIALCKLPYIDLRWKVRNSLYSGSYIYSHFFFGQERLACLRMAVRGLFDGLRGISGPYRA